MTKKWPIPEELKGRAEGFARLRAMREKMTVEPGRIETEPYKPPARVQMTSDDVISAGEWLEEEILKARKNALRSLRERELNAAYAAQIRMDTLNDLAEIILGERLGD